MRRLERQLGCTLLDRSGRQVVTRPRGDLLGLARRILGLLAGGERVGGELPLRLGVPEDFATGAMTRVPGQLLPVSIPR